MQNQDMSVRTHPKPRGRLMPSTKLAIGFVAVAALIYFGRDFVTDRMVDREFAPIKPGRLNLLGVDPEAGYRIVVQNRVAILEMGDPQDFDRPDQEIKENATDDTGAKRRVPMKELVQSIQGDEEALGRFVMIINDMKEGDLPPVQVDWRAEDIQSALKGNKALRSKLEADLGVDLNGKPLPKLSLNSLLNGIVIHSPVEVRVNIAGRAQVKRAIVKRHFQAAFGAMVEHELQEKKVRENDRAAMTGVVVRLAENQGNDPRSKDDVVRRLETAIDPAGLKSLAAPAERLLQSAVVILNDSFIEGASSESFSDAKGDKRFTLTLELTEEGRQRLWKYSKENRGTQLLVVKDGIAIAAPMVRQELSGSDVDVTQLQEESLVRDTVALVRELREGRNRR